MRLSGTLDEAGRGELVAAMLRHVALTAAAAHGINRVSLVGASRHGLDDGFALLADSGNGLNGALQGVLDGLAADAPQRLVILPGDLPQLTEQDVTLLAAAPAGTIAAAPDRHGTGTNALSLPLPDAGGFTFAFGPDSFARHRAEADRLGLRFEEIHSPGLARDVDLPEDLPDAAALFPTGSG